MSAALKNGAFSSPKKYGTNWFIPAFVKSRLGEDGIKDADGTMVWPLEVKNCRKLFLISADVIFEKFLRLCCCVQTEFCRINAARLNFGRLQSGY